VTTGISAADRAVTIKTAVARDARAQDLVSPGHVFPLKARKGGVLVRTGQTEGSVDLARLAGLEPAGVICEIMREDGEMARMPDLEVFAAKHGLLIVTIADLIEYRMQTERMIHRVSSGSLRPQLLNGQTEFQAHVYGCDVGDAEYLALVYGDCSARAERGEPVLVRVQQAAPAGDMFAQTPVNVEAMVRAALRAIVQEGAGVLLYVRSPGGSLRASFDHFVLGKPVEPRPHAGPPGALRDFGLGAQVLADLGLRKIRLMSNNPKRIAGLGGFSIEVVEQVPLDLGAVAPVVPLHKQG
jgi:3,4-dihydroxy 2-butanone 4-phosphate synthase/GTP cyclohydrolase II